MLEFGLSLDDLAHLERLSDPQILAKMTQEKRDSLNKNSRTDVIFYLNCWANLLREKWVAENPRLQVPGTEKKLKSAVLV
jgi:hypothetical protein